MKILITGGAGFLGFHLAQRLPHDAELVLLDIDAFHTPDYGKNCRCAKADIRDRAALQHFFTPDVDVVIHAAAALPLWKKADIFSVNVAGTANVLELARQAGIPRVVFVSSTAVYGVPKKHPLFETDPRHGVGPYGESKIQAEQLCEQFREQGLVVPIVRPKTFIGTGRLGVFQILYDWVQSGTRIPIIGNGRNRYQLLEVDDLVDAIWLAASAPAASANQTFNVGASVFQTVQEDVGALCDFAKSGSRVLRTPSWIVKPGLRFFELLKLSPLYKWVYGTADTDSFVSTERIQKALGWQPRYSNADALIRSYQWYLEHITEVQSSGSGVTHRVPWQQGILKVFKKIL